MLVSKSICVKITSNMCKYYKDKGYIFKCGDIIEVDIKDLPLNSNQKVDAKCEFCGAINKVSYYDYNRRYPYYCKNCKSIKIKKTNMERYGCENIFQVKEFQQKQKQTCLLKYGCENPFQCEEVKQKSRESLIKKYGADHPMKVKEISELVLNKSNATKCYNGTQKCSKEQEYIAKLYELPTNIPVSGYCLDMFSEKDNIYIEYNGGGHNLCVKIGSVTEEEFKKREIIRYKILKKSGLKGIFINSKNDILPSDSVLKGIKELSFELLNHYNINWISFDLNENKIYIKNHFFECDFYSHPVFKNILNLILTTIEDNILNYAIG